MYIGWNSGIQTHPLPVATILSTGHYTITPEHLPCTLGSDWLSPICHWAESRHRQPRPSAHICLRHDCCRGL